ncbi:heat shock factor 2-binding protein-like [Lineus longissimus]|uniref:heat shock factor 2-binding protein-like n=1 Tax=Lineus longissimus TaxID=88925 RepID=UPI00315D6D9D
MVVLALEQSKKHIEDIQGEISHWQTKVDNLSSEYMKEKEENIHLKCEIQEVSQQLQLQSDYLVHLGASSCTLLWRVSRCEESIEAIIGGTKVDDFLSLVSTTLNSFLQTYDNPEEDTDSEETQFILALCGTITNIAASAFGREFLMTNQNGHLVMDTFLHALSELKLGQCTKMKQLILMCMYNVSINQKGGRHIINHPGIIGLLVWLLQGEKASDIVLQLIRLIHSLICEQGNPKILHEVNEVLSDQLVQQLAADRNKEISQATIEMMSDIRVLKFPPLEQCRDMR